MYEKIPEGLTLSQVIVIHRHGDRAQISREIGPNYPEHDDITEIWKTKLPTEETMSILAVAANHEEGVPTSTLYTGWDAQNVPYAQLTEIGSQQLIAVGETLRQRYVYEQENGETFGKLVHTSSVADSIYCRSTNTCRTILSLRSLLAGLIQNDKMAEEDHQRPTIIARQKIHETLFPQANGIPCRALSARRQVVLPQELLYENISNLVELEAKMISLFGFEEKVNWMTIREVLKCHDVHEVEQVRHLLTPQEKETVEHMSGFMWGVMYKDDELNRLAIGRFMAEILADLAEHHQKKVLIYSGHDSTLVPVLCALGLYDDVWPPYASYLALEFATSQKTGQQFVRAVYNDATKEMNLFSSTGTEDTASEEARREEDIGLGGAWVSMDSFRARLQALSISREEYEVSCLEDVAEEDEAARASRKAFEMELKATIDGGYDNTKGTTQEQKDK